MTRPGLTVVVHVSVEVPHRDNGSSAEAPLALQEGLAALNIHLAHKRQSALVIRPEGTTKQPQDSAFWVFLVLGYLCVMVLYALLSCSLLWITEFLCLYQVCFGSCRLFLPCFVCLVLLCL